MSSPAAALAHHSEAGGRLKAKPWMHLSTVVPPYDPDVVITQALRIRAITVHSRRHVAQQVERVGW